MPKRPGSTRRPPSAAIRLAIEARCSASSPDGSVGRGFVSFEGVWRSVVRVGREMASSFRCSADMRSFRLILILLCASEALIVLGAASVLASTCFGATCTGTGRFQPPGLPRGRGGGGPFSTGLLNAAIRSRSDMALGSIDGSAACGSAVELGAA